MKLLSLFLLLFIISCTDNKAKNATQILDFGYFTIETPRSWTKWVGYGTFSAEVGGIIINKQDTLNLDISLFANTLTETDSSIIDYYKIPIKKSTDTKKLLSIDSLRPIDIDKYRMQNVVWDTIQGLKAKVTYPRQSGIGITGVYIENITDNGNSLVIYGRNINPENERLFLQVIKTIKISKKK